MFRAAPAERRDPVSWNFPPPPPLSDHTNTFVSNSPLVKSTRVPLRCGCYYPQTNALFRGETAAEELSKLIIQNHPVARQILPPSLSTAQRKTHQCHIKKRDICVSKLQNPTSWIQSRNTSWKKYIQIKQIKPRTAQFFFTMCSYLFSWRERRSPDGRSLFYFV